MQTGNLGEWSQKIHTATFKHFGDRKIEPYACPTLMIFSMWVGPRQKVRMPNFGRGTCWPPGTAEGQKI